mgnify:FL=1
MIYNSMRRLFFVVSLVVCCVVASAQPFVPPSYEFAGETVLLNTSERYERMDRELLAFTYAHQNSILILKRSERYFSMVVPILKEYGIPEDLKYLMVIESNLDPRAVSTAGAAGLWQITKGTAQTYGLEVNSNVDERYNIEKETVAACKYFKKAYERFGNWTTVAASYNAGVAGIGNRLESQHQTNAINLWMPTETTRYIYRLMAVKMLFENPAAFGFEIRERYPLLKVRETVEINDSNVDLIALAEKYGLNYAELRRANMWMMDTRLTNSSRKTYKVIIPYAGQ